MQRAARGGQINATIKDRYFGVAAATPRWCFRCSSAAPPRTSHVSQGDRGGLGRWFDREIDAVLARLGTAFPRSLRLEEQGRFAIAITTSARIGG